MQQDASPLPQFNHDDEIDLFELFDRVWNQKWLIVIVTSIALALGGSFAFLSTPMYSSKAVLLPPTEKDLIELRQPAAGSINTASTPKAVYDAFLLNLNSNMVKRIFLDRSEVKAYFAEISATAQGQWESFNQALSISLPSKTGSVSATIGFQLNNPELAADWANEYVALAAQVTRDQLTTDLQSEIQSGLNDVELQISNRRSLFQSQLDTELYKLQEALQVAQAIGLTGPLKNDAIIDVTGPTMVDEVRKLYRLGPKALEAEIAAVAARRDNEIFIPGLLQLKQKKNLLESVTIKSGNIQPVTIDLEAQVAEKPIKPQKTLILALSAALGGILGVMIALLRSAINNRKNKAAA